MSYNGAQQIAVVAGGHIPSKWAHAINVVQHARAFSLHGYTVKVFSPLRYAEQRLLRREGLKAYGDCHGVDFALVRARGLDYYTETHVIRLVASVFHRYTGYHWLHESKTERQVAERICQEGYRHAYCRTFAAAEALIRQRVATVLETHNPALPESAVVRRLCGLRESRFFRGFVTISPLVKDRLEQIGFKRDHIVVLDSAVDTDMFSAVDVNKSRLERRAELRVSYDSFIVMYTGHLYPGRGIEVVIAAARDASDMTFVFVGGVDRDIAKYKKMASGIRNVHFVGHVPHPCVAEFMAAADVLVMPYTTDTPTHRQMSPLKMFEYMAAGKPIVASDLPRISQVLQCGENALLIPEKDPCALRKALELLRDSVLLRERIGTFNRSSVHRYSLRLRATRILQLLDCR